MKKLGVIVNPVAGVGGRVGLKGSDGAEILRKALELGAAREAPRRAQLALERLARLADEIEVLTGPGEMGEDEARAAGLEPTVVGSLAGRRTWLEVERGRGHDESALGAAAAFAATTPADTEETARALEAAGVDLILFAGGDGTARDIYRAIGDRVPVIGVPAGVKIHSAVYATTPAAAGDLVALYLHDRPSAVRLRECEVMDIDEEAFRDDRVSAHLYGYMKVPVARGLVQSAKAGGVAGELSVLHDVAMDVIQHMQPGELQILGPGTTTRTIMERLELPSTLLGVDAVVDGKLAVADATEADLLDAARAPCLGAHHRHRHRRPGPHLRARQPADQPCRHPPCRPRPGARHRHADQAALAGGPPAARRHRRPRARRRAARLRQGHDRPRRTHDVQGRRLIVPGSAVTAFISIHIS